MRPRLYTTGSGAALAVLAGALLAASFSFPWWRMESRAPQYGMRVLVIEVAPTGVTGDVKEIDGLGHYVGIYPMENFAPIERAAAPYAMALAVLAALSLPLWRPGWKRTCVGALVVCVPLGFVLDLWAWQQYAVTHLDPHAPLNLIADRIESRLYGAYAVAQFKVLASFETGFWFTVIAAGNALALLVFERRDRAEAASAPAPLPSPGAGEAEARPSAAPAAVGRSGAVAVALALGVAGASIALGGPRAAHAATLEVGPTAPHQTIGAAIAAANDGDTILVRAGIYQEPVTVDRALVLTAETGAVIDGAGTGTVVTITAAGSTLRGFAIRGSGQSLLTEDAAVRVQGAERCTIEGNVIEDALFGVLVRSSPHARVIGNRITGKDLPLPRRADGIQLNDASDSLIERNVIERSRDLSIWSSSRTVARHNTVRGSRYGLHYMYCDNDLFEDNVFEQNGTGGAIMYSRRLTLRRNRFSGSRGPSAHGLLLKAADDVIAEGNWFTDNTRGVFVEDTTTSRYATCTFRSNLFGGNEVGVALSPTASRLVFTENAFVANRVQVEALGWARPEQNAWSADGRGNYWSDYAGFDADGDGVGDTPHRVEQFFEALADRWPAVGLLRMGPAMEAVETAARAFPVVPSRTACLDERPLIEPPASLGPAPGSARRLDLAAAGALACAGAALALLRARGAP